MFQSKQSDYWFKEDTREFLVCAVTSVSAQGPPCKGDLIAHFPCIYSINKNTNKKKLIFPSDITDCSSAQLTSESAPGYMYSFVPSESADINISEISKPIISYNEKSDLYNITYLGRYQSSSDGFSIFSYVFQYVDEYMKPIDSRVILPESKRRDLNFTFANGNIHRDFYVDGNSTATNTTVFGVNSNIDIGERPPNYKIRPFHKGDDIVFNTAMYSVSCTELTANSSLPLGHSGGFITQTPNTLAYTTNHCIRVDFTCKSYSLPGNDQIGFLGTRTISGTPLSSSRAIQQHTLSAGPAEGFCVFFYEQPDVDLKLDLNGVNSSMGYCPSTSTQLEEGGFDGWSTTGINLSGFVGIAFDIAGNFCTTTEGKPGSYNNTTYTQTMCSIGVRAGNDNNYKTIGQSTQITSIPLHETVTAAANATYKDFRVELSQMGRTIIVSGKISTDAEYTELYRLNMAKLVNFDFTVPKNIKVGLSCTTSLSVFNFELKSFKVEGITQ
tara:strand:+ start:2735 stop:4228 length:1494 start_codon:yes stop_codon:yes gene_type:complete